MRLRAFTITFSLLSILAPLTACGGGSGGAGGSGTSSGSGGMEALCPPGSHQAPAGCEATFEGWTETSSLVHARDHHVSWVAETPAGAFFYAATGTDDMVVYADVERAPINPDGTLGAFVKAGKLPKATLGSGFAQVDRTMVLAGGADGFSSLADVFVGTIADDGSVTFTTGPSLAVDRYHVSLSVHGGYLYAIGGLQQSGMMQQVMPTIERATFDGTTVGTWEMLDPLPAPLTHQAAVVYQDALYLVGGISTTTTLTTVQRATFDAQGKLSAFTTVGMLPQGRGTSAGFVFLDQLYVIGGASLAQGGEVATTMRAPVAADGTVGAFEMLAPLPQARAHVHQNPMYQGFVYSAGGMVKNMIEKEVYVGKLD